MDIALLAPVPLEHLLEGLKTCAMHGKVAFGTRAFDPFAKIRDAHAEGCDVFIYASHASGSGTPKATWKARYLGFVEAKNGAHPSGMKFRPTSTIANSSDNKGHWFLFWEVADLIRMDDPIEISALRGAGKASNYKVNYVPEGPIVIGSPA